MNTFGFMRELDIPFETAIERVTEELKKEGFGVLTSINMKEKFKEKLNIDFKKYVILGACNPALAHKSLGAEESIGLMLPCNAIVYEKGDKTIVGIIKPSAAMGMIENEELKGIAETAEAKLKKVSESL